MKAVLDTNVIFSGLWSTNSNPSRVLDLLWQGAFEAVITDELERELRTVLTRSHFLTRMVWNERDVGLFIDSLLGLSVKVETDRRLTILKDDSDNRLLEAANASQADYLVSGDKPVLALQSYKGTLIVTPARFLQILEEQA